MERFAYTGMGITGIAILLLCVKAAYVALAIWMELAYPRFCEQVHSVFVARKRLTLVVGVVNSFFLFVIIAVLFNNEPLAMLGFVVLAFCAALSVAAYGAAYRDLGQRLEEVTEGSSPVRTLLRGGLLAEASFLVPFYGQALSFYTFFRGLGAVIITVLTQRKAARAAKKLAKKAAKSDA